MIIIIFFIAHWYLSLFFQTFFHHRYAAHRMFTMSKFWEKVFYIAAFIAQGSSFLSPRAYAILHRMHHAYADTEKDPHSPKYDSNLFTMMWRTKITYSNILNNKTEVEERFTKELPDWDAFEKLTDKWFFRIFWMLAYTVFYVVFATSPWLFLLLPIHFVMGPFHGVIINWFAHKYGYRNFDLKDTSRNLLPVDFLMLGESFHNNHHKYGARANFGVKWFEIDPVYIFIRLFNKLKIIKIRSQNA